MPGAATPAGAGGAAGTVTSDSPWIRFQSRVISHTRFGRGGGTRPGGVAGAAAMAGLGAAAAAAALGGAAAGDAGATAAAAAAGAAPGFRTAASAGAGGAENGRSPLTPPRLIIVS
jgi:hypothetical protein